MTPLETGPVWWRTSWQRFYCILSVSSLCLNISKIKRFETSMSTGSLEKKNAEGKGSEYGISSVIFGWRSWAVCQGITQEERGGCRNHRSTEGSLCSCSENSPGDGKVQAVEKMLLFTSCYQKDFRQRPSQLENPSTHIQRWHMSYTLWPEGNSFLHRLLDLHIKKKKGGNEM